MELHLADSHLAAGLGRLGSGLSQVVGKDNLGFGEFLFFHGNYGLVYHGIIARNLYVGMDRLLGA